MKTVFQSRADQVADYLREKLRAGHWENRLPPERDLAHQLGVSRRSLRAALSELQREGLLLKRSQAGTLLVPERKRRKAAPISVGIVYSSKVKQIVGRGRVLLDEVHRIFDTRQIRTEVHKAPYLKGDKVSVHFKKLVQETPHTCWMLVSPTVAIQKWCKQNGIPAMMFGSGDEPSGLPCVAMNHYALCRHAAGEMLRRGHRRLALILPTDEKGEDVQSRLGFQAGVEESLHPDATVIFERHDQSIQGVCRLANRLLESDPRPTAWLVCRQEHFLTIFSHLMHRGLRMPGDVSLVSRDADLYIGDLVPEPTRYVSNVDLLARQCARLALKFMGGQCAPGERIWLMPDFVPGQTLGAPPVPPGDR